MALILSGCSGAQDPWEKVEGKGPKVLVSFPPLYCFTKSISGDNAQVLSLLTSVGPHDYSPSAKDVLKAMKADVFLVNGLTLDDWVSKIVNSSGNTKLKLIKVAEVIPEDQRLAMAEHEHDHDHGEEGHHHHHGEHDPHVWLGIEPTILMVDNLAETLSKAAPEHKETYFENAKKFKEKLQELHKYGKDKFAGIKNKKIIATHDSLGYFARSFGLEVVDNIMPQPGVEASGSKLAKLVETCKKDNIQVITVEPQYSKATAETLLKQVQKEVPGIQIVEFNTLETAPPGFDADYYITEMKNNIDRLAKVLRGDQE